MSTLKAARCRQKKRIIEQHIRQNALGRTFRRIMKVPGARLRRWNRPAHLRRISMSSSARSSQVMSPRRTISPSSPTSVHIMCPPFSVFTFSALAAFLCSARICACSDTPGERSARSHANVVERCWCRAVSESGPGRSHTKNTRPCMPQSAAWRCIGHYFKVLATGCSVCTWRLGRERARASLDRYMRPLVSKLAMPCSAISAFTSSLTCARSQNHPCHARAAVRCSSLFRSQRKQRSVRVWCASLLCSWIPRSTKGSTHLTHASLPKQPQTPAVLQDSGRCPATRTAGKRRSSRAHLQALLQPLLEALLEYSHSPAAGPQAPAAAPRCSRPRRLCWRHWLRPCQQTRAARARRSAASAAPAAARAAAPL